MSGKRPMLYLTWDDSGMSLWLGPRPERRREGNVLGAFASPDAVRMRLPVSWYGGLVDEYCCREFDPEIIFGFDEEQNAAG